MSIAISVAKYPFIVANKDTFFARFGDFFFSDFNFRNKSSDIFST